MKQRRTTPFLLCLAACAPVVAGSSSAPAPTTAAVPATAMQEAELGFLGFQPPEVGDVRLTDTLLHQDTTGGVVQQLLGIASARGGGFGLVWRDQRDGSLGIYTARTDADGTLREPERPVSSAGGTTRRFDPAIGVAPDGSGAVVWVSRQGGPTRPWLRFFDKTGAWYGGDLVVPDPEGAAGGPGAGRGGAGARDSGAGARSPVVLARHDGSRSLVWVANGRLRVADFDVAGAPLRAPADFGPTGTEPEPGIFALEDAQGGIAVLWTGKSGVWLARRPAAGGKSSDVQLGDGRARGLALAPGGGFWTVVERGESAVLRRVSNDGKLDGNETVRAIAGLRDLDFAAYDGGLALLATSGGAPAASDGGRGRREQVAGPSQRAGQRNAPARGERASDAGGAARVELVLFDASGVAQGDALAVVSADGRDVADAHVASNGARLMVAWTDARLGEGDVFTRIVDPSRTGAERLGPEKRLNTDVASADQINPDIDARGDRGWTVWQDKRASTAGSIYARAFDASGPRGDEILLPRTHGGAAALTGSASDPCVSMRADGSALFVWTQRDEGRARVVGQVLAADGTARSPLLEIDVREPGTTEQAATAPLSGDRGWIVAWPAGGKLGIHARRVGADGALPGPARKVSETSDDEVSQVAVALLDDGRVVAAWTHHQANAGQDKGWTVRARFLDAEGTPKGAEVAFEPSRRNEDHDPALAPAKNNGFMMAWCSGLPTDPTHDVNVRLFDAQGRPAGPNVTPCFLANEQDYPDITRLADGSFAVVWEDDVSYFDQSYVRRIHADGKTLGAWMRIGKLDAKSIIDRVEPRIAALGDGWASVFCDRQRSLGFDARLKIVGPKFDAPTGQ